MPRSVKVLADLAPSHFPLDDLVMAASSAKSSRIHPSAIVDPKALIGAGTRVWHLAQVREGAVVGEDCILGKGAYVDEHVRIGDRVKIQNGAAVYSGSTLEDGVFIGPQACLTNDRRPRSISPDGRLKGAADWESGTILVRTGAAVGAGAIILTGITIGQWAMVGAGAIVTRDVPDYGLVVGNPARLIGYACACGHRLHPAESGTLTCPSCGATYEHDQAGKLRAVRASQPV